MYAGGGSLPDNQNHFLTTKRKALMKSMQLFIVAIVLMGAVIGGCKKDDPASTQGQSTTYAGTFANATESGSMTYNAAPGKTFGTDGAVTGTLKLVSPAAATITVTGTLNGTALTLTGGGYTFTGTLSGSTLAGSYTGPNGPGTFTTQVSTNSSAKIYVGTYTTQVTGRVNGTFNMVINGSVITGIVASSAGNGQFGGTLSGTAITIFSPAAPTVTIATGVVAGTTVSGTYNDQQGDNGVWSGTQVQ